MHAPRVAHDSQYARYSQYAIFARWRKSAYCSICHNEATVKSRCNEHRYSDYLEVTIPLACTDLVHTILNDYLVVAIIVVILSFPLV